MDHTTDEQLQSFLDHEDSDSERAALMRHVETCVACHGRLEALEALVADVSNAVGLLRPPAVERPAFAVLEARAFAADTAAPAAGLSNGAVAPQASPSLPPPAAGRSFSAAAFKSTKPSPAVFPTLVRAPRSRQPASSRSSRTLASWLRAAAVILAVTGVAGAATIVVQRRALDRAQQGAVGQERADPAVIAEPQAARSGVSVMPNAGRIVVAVRGAAAGTTIDVGVAESSAASAFVGGDGEGIRFSAQTGRIDVDVTGRSIALDVRLPASATNATLEVDGRIRARKVDGVVRIERGGSEVMVRARTGR